MRCDIDYKKIYRNVKYPRLEFKTGDLVLILSEDHNPEEIIEKHKSWIYKKKDFIRRSLEASKDKKIFDRTEKEFRELVYSIVEGFSDDLDLNFNKIYFRKMRTKWASCSSKKNLTINKLMRYLPLNLIEYVIFHELAHLIEKKHNKNFWSIISKKFDNYEELEKELFVYWFLIQKTKLNYKDS